MSTVEEGIPANARTYTLIHGTWKSENLIEINIQGAPANLPMLLPVEFVRDGGDNTWNFVHKLISVIVNEPGRLLLASDKTQMALQAEPLPGAYDFVPVIGMPTGNAVQHVAD